MRSSSLDILVALADQVHELVGHARTRMLGNATHVRLAQVARLLLAFIFILNGLNWWWKVLPYPSASDPPLGHTPPFVQAMIDTGFMFAGIKVAELVIGLMLLVNRWVPLALIVAFPVSVGIWSVDFFLIAGSLRAQVFGWSVLALNTYLLLAYLRYFAPILATHATAWQAEADDVNSRPFSGGIVGSKPAVGVLGLIAVVLGMITSVWLVAMVVQQLAR